MIENDGGTVRAVAWKELCPWLSIFRVFRLSIAFPAILLGAAAILLTAVGWGTIALVFSTDSPATAWLAPYAKSSWLAVTDLVPNKPALPGMAELHKPNMPAEAGWQSSGPVFGPWSLLSRPAWEGLFNTGLPLSALACLLLCGLWGVAVWALFGGAIARVAAVQLAAQERVGLAAALRHAASKWPAYCAAPLLPIGGVLLATVPVFVLGLLLRANFGVLLAGLLWPLALAMGLMMTLLLLGLLFGWPLMWATISTECTDSFDALSRCYAYVFQRPLHYLFYALVAAVVGGLGWLLVQNFAAGVVWMAYWAAGWGSGGEHLKSVMGVEGGKPLEGIGYAGAAVIHFWAGCVKLAAVGYLFSYFWTASTAIYLLLRRDVDATEMDEVFLDADAGEQTYGLPPIQTDAAGAPVVNDDAAPPAEKAGPAAADGAVK
jgi:hypothetical protein